MIKGTFKSNPSDFLHLNGFSITLLNGYRVSVQGDRKYNHDGEIAILDPYEEFVPYEGEDVTFGFTFPKLMKILDFANNL